MLADELAVVRVWTIRAGRSFELRPPGAGRGTFKLGINAQSNGNLITSDRNRSSYFPNTPAPPVGENAVTIGVLRIRAGADLTRCEPACKRFTADVRVLTLDQFIAKERDFWDHVRQ